MHRTQSGIPTRVQSPFLVFRLVLSAVFGAAYPFVFHTVPEDPLKGPAATSVIPWILVILFGIAAGPLTFAMISFVNAIVHSGNPPSEETGNWFFERRIWCVVPNR